MYSSSIYNMLFTAKGRDFVFNSLSGALCELDTAALSHSLTTGDVSGLSKSDVNTFLDCGLVVEDHEKEKQLIANRFASRADDKMLGITIAPTLRCNLACPYCLEPINDDIMTGSVADSVVEFVRLRAKAGYNLTVTWYGGEPLLEPEIIESLSEQLISICTRFGVTYSAKMVTNGFLLNDNMLSRMSKAQVSAYQITLDGSEAIHDSRRMQKDGKGTYRHVLEAIARAHKCGFNVNVRINIASGELHQARSVLTELKNLNLIDLDIHLGMIKQFHSCHAFCAKQNDARSFSKDFLLFSQMLLEQGFVTAYTSSFPRPISNSCSFTNPNAFIVAPDGKLYKCIADIGIKDLSVGSILNFEDELHLQTMPFPPYSRCEECFTLPICMGNCPRKPSECSVWKWELKNYLTDYCSAFA